MSSEHLNDIEEKLSASLGSGVKEWQAIALLLSAVEQNKLWATEKYHSFSAWMDSLPGRFQVSIGWLWRIHKASKSMVAMHMKKYPESESGFAKIRDKYPRTSATALEYVAKISGLNPPKEVLENIEEEVLGGTASVTVLKEKYKQYAVAAQSRSSYAHLLAACFEISFLSIVKLGHLEGKLEKQKTSVQKITANLAHGSSVDLIITIPQLDDIPKICAVITPDKIKDLSPDLGIFDRVFCLCEKDDESDYFRDDIDKIKVDVVGRKFALERASDIQETNLDQKLVLCARLYGSTLTKQPIAVSLSD